MNQVGLHRGTALRRTILYFLLTSAGACGPGADHQLATPPVGEPVFEAPVSATKPPPPITGGTLAVLPDGHTAVAADPDRDRIFVVDYQAGIVMATVTLQAGDEPGRVVPDDQGRVHVALRRGGAVVTLAPPTWAIAARRPICAAPRGLAYAPATQLLHVACAEGELVSLPAAPDGTVTRRLALDSDLRDVVVKGDRLFVSRFRSAEVLVVDGESVSARLRPSDRVFFFPTGNAGTSAVQMTPAVAWRMIDDPTGDVVLLHQRAVVGSVTILPGGYAGSGCRAIVETTVSAMGPSRPMSISDGLSDAVLAVDVALSPSGEFTALAVPGNARQAQNGQRQVMVVPTQVVTTGGLCYPMSSDYLPAPGQTQDGSTDGGATDDGATDGGATNADADQPDGRDRVRIAQPTEEVVAVAFDRLGNLLVQTREPATLQIATQQGRSVSLSMDSRLDTGHAIFHAGTAGGLACASCHPEGGDDGRVWQFRAADGALMLRRTQNLRGGILPTAPFHWDGALPTLEKLVTEVFVGRMSGPPLDTDMVGTLRRWLDTIPAMPAYPVSDDAAVERGRALFNGAPGCATCHSGSLLTNNQNKDVGTGGPLQVPSLRGESWRAPYMHDGCAATLRDRFSEVCGGGDQHGVTSGLAPGDIADLLAFLATL